MRELSASGADTGHGGCMRAAARQVAQLVHAPKFWNPGWFAAMMVIYFKLARLPLAALHAANHVRVVLPVRPQRCQSSDSGTAPSRFGVGGSNGSADAFPLHSTETAVGCCCFRLTERHPRRARKLATTRWRRTRWSR